MDSGRVLEYLYHADRLFWKEFVLFGLSEYSVVSKKILSSGTRFADLVGSMFDLDSIDFGEEEG